MRPRNLLIAVLVVIELAIVGEAVVAVQGGEMFPDSDTRAASDQQLAEGGAHRFFAAGDHPQLTVDIGYADLTLRTDDTSQIDAGLSPSTTSGWFRSTAAITARKDGNDVRVGTVGGRSWSTGDDRMVTVVVPPQTRVTVISAGNIDATGLRAETSLKSVGSGTVTLEDFDVPRLHVTASDGTIEMHGIVATRLEARSDDGRIEATGLNAQSGSVSSDDGRVVLGFAPGADTVVNAQTNDGKITALGFAADATSNETKDDDSSSQTVRIGAGTGHLNVHTDDGNIELQQDG